MKKINLEEYAKQYAEAAVNLARKLGIIFDYTNESVEKVEQILELLYQEAQKHKIPEEEYLEKANIFGCYLGNTLIKNLQKGKWAVESVNNAVAVKLDNEYIFFPAKVYKRLKNCLSDNVIALYQTMYNRFSKTQISLRIFQK